MEFELKKLQSIIGKNLSVDFRNYGISIHHICTLYKLKEFIYKFLFM